MSSAGPDEDSTAGEGLLRRWARRKQAAKVHPVPAIDGPAPASAGPQALGGADEPALALPDLDTLGAGSDYSAFLQTGVPAELQRLALQRAWSSDAAIAEFRGMAEYAWDFNAPQYGMLWAVDDVAKLVQAVTAPPPVTLPPATPPHATLPDAAPAPAEPGPAAVPDAPPMPVAVNADAGEAAAPAPSRRHGSALPC